MSVGTKGDDFDMFKVGDDNSDGLIKRFLLADTRLSFEFAEGAHPLGTTCTKLSPMPITH